MTKLVFLSDTHNKHYQIEIPPCDILCHSGDFTGLGRSREVRHFLKWFSKQPATHKVFIAGNHDISFANQPLRDQYLKDFPNLHYLHDNGVELEGLNIYGSPWQPEFHPETWVFNLPRDSKQLSDVWDMIPEDTDILLTHSPPNGILDLCKNQHPYYPQVAGCEILKNRVEKISPLVHSFGHIHEGYGTIERPETLFINASSCNLQYQPVNPPVVVEVTDGVVIDVSQHIPKND